jgi:hypothetical protein
MPSAMILSPVSTCMTSPTTMSVFLMSCGDTHRAPHHIRAGYTRQVLQGGDGSPQGINRGIANTKHNVYAITCSCCCRCWCVLM